MQSFRAVSLSVSQNFSSPLLTMISQIKPYTFGNTGVYWVCPELGQPRSGLHLAGVPPVLVFLPSQA